MQCFLLCVVVIIGISGGQARPQGFFGGLLPPPAAAPAEGGSPPKGPLAIFTQGQQAAQNVVGGFISGLAETRDKIRNETKKRIQSLLGNKNKDAEVPPQKPSEAVDPDKEVEAAPPKIEQAPDKEETSKKPHEKEETSSVFNEPLNNLEKVKQSGNIDKPMPTKGTTDNPEIDKLIEDVFADVDPTQEALGAKEKEEKKEGEEV